MNSLEFIEQQIEAYKKIKKRAILQIPDEDDEEELLRLQCKIDIADERLQTLHQIKAELEAWYVVKEELQITSKSKNPYGEPLRRYELNVIGQNKIDTLNKGLEVKE